ncbi:MAG: VOC family protein, partial [Vibrio sp.]
MKTMKKVILTSLVAATLGLGLGACSTTNQVELPALSQSQQKHEGQVIWRDLVTSEPEKVQSFYHDLFGWDFEAISDDYSIIRYQGVAIGGIARLPSDNISSYWLPVLSSDDLSQTLNQAKTSGAKVLIDSTNLKGRGDIAVIQDPQGAVFSVLDTVSGDPTQLPATAGNWMWQEVWSDDQDQSQGFYQQLAGYTAKERQFKNVAYRYLEIDNTPAFGVVQTPNDEVPNTWVNYVRVDDVEQTLKTLQALGGEVLMAPTPEVRNSSVALVRDP